VIVVKWMMLTQSRLTGAGKTTFVDILAGKRKGNGTVTGSVKMFADNGNNSGSKHRIGFVDQVSISFGPQRPMAQVLIFSSRISSLRPRQSAKRCSSQLIFAYRKTFPKQSSRLERSKSYSN
jgi:ABC-type multidrug transport system ATPase subunit